MSVAWRPHLPCATITPTLWPGSGAPRSARLSTVPCTSTSRPQLSRTTKPYPLTASQNLTKPWRSRHLRRGWKTPRTPVGLPSSRTSCSRREGACRIPSPGLLRRGGTRRPASEFRNLLDIIHQVTAGAGRLAGPSRGVPEPGLLQRPAPLAPVPPPGGAKPDGLLAAGGYGRGPPVDPEALRTPGGERGAQRPDPRRRAGGAGGRALAYGAHRAAGPRGTFHRPAGGFRPWGTTAASAPCSRGERAVPQTRR